MSQSADETTTPAAAFLPDPPTTADPPAPVATAVDTAARAESPSLSLDGELPRLGGAPTPTLPPESRPPSPEAPTVPTTQTTDASADGDKLELPRLPTLPTAASVITGPGGIPAPDQHSAPSTATPDGAEPTPAGDHPMAHLMPQKTAPSEASQRAADIRAAKKAKARKVKIGVAIGSMVVVAVVGPPLGRWLADAVNEAGNTSTEEPAG